MDGQDNILKGPDGTALRFYKEAVKNNFASEKTGTPCYDSVLFVEVMTPGSNESAPTFEIERTFCEQANIKEPRKGAKYDHFKQQIDAFKSQDGSVSMEGTPLSQWPAIDVAMAATLKGMRLYTVEQLAEVSDGTLTKLGLGARHLREQAIQYLASRQFSVPTAELTAKALAFEEENTRLKDEVKALNDRLTNALSELDALKAQQPAPPPQQPLISLADLGKTNAQTNAPAKGKAAQTI